MPYLPDVHVFLVVKAKAPLMHPPNPFYIDFGPNA
jgi:hypothetical protein